MYIEPFTPTLIFLSSHFLSHLFLLKNVVSKNVGFSERQTDTYTCSLTCLFIFVLCTFELSKHRQTDAQWLERRALNHKVVSSLLESGCVLFS